MNAIGLDRLSDAEVFLAVVDGGGFSGGARLVGRSQPAVSRRVAALEARLGTRLLERTTRHVRLTAAGEGFLRGCREALAALRDAESLALDATAVVRGPLRVSAPPAWSRAVLVPLLAELVRAHPELSFELLLVERYVDLVEEGVDVALRLGPLRASSLTARRIDGGRFVLCAAPSYLRRKAAPRSVADLARHDALVLTTSNERRRWPFRERGRAVAFEPRGRIAANDVGLLREAAVAGQGVTVLPSYLVATDLREGRLVELLPRARLPRLDVFALLPSRRHVPRKARVFVDALAARLADGAARA